MASNALAHDDYDELSREPDATAPAYSTQGEAFYGGVIGYPNRPPRPRGGLRIRSWNCLLKDSYAIVFMQPQNTPHAAAMETVPQPAAREDATSGAQEPAWREPTVFRLRQLLQLPEAWDSYRARKIEQHAAGLALTLLESAADENLPAPTVVPTAQGGVQLEWHAWGIDMELDVRPAGSPQVFFRDRREQREWEAELGADLGLLSDALRILAQRAGQGRGR